MPKDRFEMEGVVTECLPNTKFKVEIKMKNNITHTCICTLSGKMRVNQIKILKGDKVTVDLSINDPGFKNGRIIWRDK